MSIKVGEYVGQKVWQNVDKYAWDANDEFVYMWDDSGLILNVKRETYRIINVIIETVYT